MILGQISYLDIAVFLLFLVPQLLIHVGLFGTIGCGIRALPFLCEHRSLLTTTLKPNQK